MNSFHLSHLPEVQAAIAAASACTTIAELQAAAVAFDACAHARDNPARPGGPGPRCTVERPVMVLGKTPASTESGTGIPYSGPAGQVLRDAFAGLGYDLDAAWLTCASYWRAPQNLPKATQLAWSRPFLHAEIRIARPAVILVLGDKALEGLTGERGQILPKMGEWREFDADGLAVPAIVNCCHGYVNYGVEARMPGFRAVIAKAAEAHPEAFEPLRFGLAEAA